MCSVERNVRVAYSFLSIYKLKAAGMVLVSSSLLFVERMVERDACLSAYKERPRKIPGATYNLIYIFLAHNKQHVNSLLLL